MCVCVFALFLLHANNCAADSQSQRVEESARWQRRAFATAEQRTRAPTSRCLVYELEAAAACSASAAAGAGAGSVRTLTQQARQARQQNYKHKYAIGICTNVCVRVSVCLLVNGTLRGI